MPSLSQELRTYNAQGNHIGAEHKMARAAGLIDELVKALQYYDELPSLMTAERAVAHVALMRAEEVGNG